MSAILRSILGTLTTLTLLVSVLPMPARASSPVYLESPVANKSWQYTQLNHDGFLGTGVARDISHSTWTSDEYVTFSFSSGANISGYVEQATTNCPTGGPDKFVKLQLWDRGTNEYYGKLVYVHMRSLSVSAGNWILSGATLGQIQDTASSYNGTTCWTGVHVHLETDTGTWTSASLNSPQSYSTQVITIPGGIQQRPQQTLQQGVLLHADTRPFVPVTK